MVMLEKQQSSSSTFAVSAEGFSNKADSSSDCCHLPPSKRAVRFASSDLNVYHEDEWRCHEEDLDLTWYTSDEYDAFRKDSQSIVLETKKIVKETSRDDGCSKDEKTKRIGIRALVKTLQTVFQATSNINIVMTDVSQQLFDKEVLEYLGELYQDHIELIGLEMYIVQELQTESRERRDSVQEAAFDVLAEFNQGMWTEDELDEELQESCNDFSQAMVLFAQALAIGQRLSDAQTIV